MFIAGPPGAGKTSFVRKHAKATDIVIDFDAIGAELGYDRNRGSDAIGLILGERNRRLAALATASPDATAWVIAAAPSAKLRRWWRATLNVQPDDCLLILTDRQLCRERIRRDPSRRGVINAQLDAVDRWFERERIDDPGRLQRGCDINGFPLDPLHPWNVTT
jgi:hypothetical protein